MQQAGDRIALRGLRVLDLSTNLAGQLAATVLGDYGAEVIRVDSGTGPEEPDAPFLGRNKRIVRGEGGDVRTRAILAGADVVVTTSSEAHTVAEDARADHPSIVHLSLPYFRVREDVPSRAADGLQAAATGISSRLPSNDGKAVESVNPYLSYEQALWGATSAVAAILERDRSGRGQLVTVDGLQGALIASAVTIVIDPEVPPPSTAVGPAGPNPTYATYQGSDGQWLLVAALMGKFIDRLFDLLGITEIMDWPGIAGDYKRLYSPQERDRVRAKIAEAFQARPRDAWLELLHDIDVPASVVGQPEDYLDHEQSLALGLKQTVQDPVVGTVEMPSVPVALSGSPAAAPRARVFDQTADWTTSHPPVSGSPAPIDDAPLSGYRVLDLGAVLAGPYAGALLASLGADVIKVEPPKGDDFRDIGWYNNRGQRSLAIDLRDPRGYEAFTALVRRSDAVIDNFRPGVPQRLRVDYGSLVEVNPGIITASITGYGSVGPLGGRPGFDPILQAAAGMMAAQGGDSPPVFSSLAVNDVTSACVTALGIVVALYERARSGRGQHCDIVMAAVAAFMQGGSLVRYPGRPAPERGYSDYKGPSALDRLYEAADGELRLWLPSVAAAAAAGLTEGGTATDEELAAEIALQLRSLTVAEAISAVRTAGGEAVAAVRFRELVADPDVVDGAYFERVAREDGKFFYAPDSHSRFSRSTIRHDRRPPGVGEHSREVLAEAALPDEVIDALLEAGTVSQRGPMTYFEISVYR